MIMALIALAVAGVVAFVWLHRHHSAAVADVATKVEGDIEELYGRLHAVESSAKPTEQK